MLLNTGDFGFIKVYPLKVQLEKFRGNLHLIKDDLIRKLVWSHVWISMKDFKLTPLDYLSLLEDYAKEDNLVIIQDESARFSAVVGTYLPRN